MRQYKKGDPCPCCGQPIKTDDPEVLALLGWIGDHRRLPSVEEIEGVHRLFLGEKREPVKNE